MPKKNSSYGLGTINYSDVKAELSQHGGEILVHVVMVDGSSSDKRLKYGLFYKDAEQRVFDVVARSTNHLKTFFTSDSVVKASSELTGHGRVEIPILSMENAIEFGALR